MRGGRPCQERIWLTAFVVVFISGEVLAQDEEKKPDAFAQQRARVKRVNVNLNDKPCELLRGPLYTYEEVIEKWHSGTSWVWGTKGRPAVFLNMMTQGGTRYFEFISLTSGTLKVSIGKQMGWQPEPNWNPKIIKGEAPPSANRKRRLIQMRSLARRFKARQVHFGQVQRLRGLPQPIYRYASESDNSLDGAIFAYLRESDLETILVIDAQKQKDGSAIWVFDCMPVSIDYQEMQFDEKIVWERKRISYSQAGLSSASYHIYTHRPQINSGPHVSLGHFVAVAFC